MQAQTKLTTGQQAFYHEYGYVHVRGLLTPAEAAAYRAEVHAIVERQGSNDATWDSVRGSGTTITHCHDVQFRSAAFTRLLVDARLTAVAQSIIGPNVQLHHTKVFVKPPEKGSPFPMHQDYPYFPHRDHSMIAAILHFDDAPDEKGMPSRLSRQSQARPAAGNGEGPSSARGSLLHIRGDADSGQGGRCDLPVLPPGSRLRRERVERAAHDIARADARPRRSAARGAAQLEGPGHDDGRDRSDRVGFPVRLGEQGCLTAAAPSRRSPRCCCSAPPRPTRARRSPALRCRGSRSGRRCATARCAGSRRWRVRGRARRSASNCGCRPPIAGAGAIIRWAMAGSPGASIARRSPPRPRAVTLPRRPTPAMSATASTRAGRPGGPTLSRIMPIDRSR